MNIALFFLAGALGILAVTFYSEYRRLKRLNAAEDEGDRYLTRLAVIVDSALAVGAAMVGWGFGTGTFPLYVAAIAFAVGAVFAILSGLLRLLLYRERISQRNK